MKILITGAQGMLGQQLAKIFNDHDLTLWDKQDLDITNNEQVEQKISSLHPDLVINSAAYNDVDACETNFDLAKSINADGPVNLAKSCQKINATFIHYSTDYVFDGTKKEGYLETDTPNPISKYGQSKLLGERALNHCNKCYIIRTSRLFGKPAISDGAKKSFVDVMITLAENRDTLDVVDEEFSNPTYVNDLATQTRLIFDQKLDFGLYHAVNQGACTWYNFAKEIFVISAKTVTINPVTSDKFPRPAKRPPFSSLLNTKSPKLRPWQDALREYLKP